MVPNLRGDTRAYFNPVSFYTHPVSKEHVLATAEVASLRQELTGLEALEYQMARNVDALRQRRADAHFASTLAGMAFNWGGRLFAVYCVFRIVSVRLHLFQLLTPRRAYSCPSPSML